MAKASRKAGATSNMFTLRLLDSSATDGSGLTGLVAADLTCYYCRDSASADVVVSLINSGTLGTFAAGNILPWDATHQPGLYQFHAPDAALASGAKNVVFFFMKAGAKTIKQEAFEVELTANDNQDAVRSGMTALPNAVAAATGGLPIIGTGAGCINVDGAGNVIINDPIKKGIALNNFQFLMTDSVNHAPKASATGFTLTRNIDGAGFGAGTIGSVTEIGSGWYKVNLGGGDMNGTCIAFRFQATGCDDLDFTLFPQP